MTDRFDEMARELTGHHQTPPCDCIEFDPTLGLWALKGCYCANRDDASHAGSWATAANLERQIAARLRTVHDEAVEKAELAVLRRRDAVRDVPTVGAHMADACEACARDIRTLKTGGNNG